ncbi:condensation domain-containing protein [Methanoculleus sp. MH98A]|uniref:condensation domain-containing protein n=1 Tax=Methanoculleus sp. MH98A TaxID=1495314 RepID=UPI00049FF5C2|nr:condensation domain-containing protein [Methanoculleus sp. MH98A]KDE56058.1 condensation protein [Methanoculleus sp. MH98A]
MSSPPIRHPAPAFDIFNVYFERIYDPTMHVVFALDGEVDEGAMRAATMRVVASDPYLRSRFAEVDGRPVWEEIPEEQWEEAFVLAGAGGDEPLHTPPPPLDVRSGPQVRVGLYRRKEGDLVTVSCHHGFCDATGALTLARVLFAAYRRIADDPGFRPPPREPYERSTDRILALYSGEERQQALAEEEQFIDRWRFPSEQTGRGTPRIARRTLSPERLGRIKAFGREHGATVNDVLIAAFFLAFQKIRDEPADREEPRSLLTSADLRRRYPGLYEDCPLTNLSIAYEVTLSSGEGARLEDIIGRVTAITARRKAGSLGVAAILFYEELMAGGMAAVRAFFDDMIERYRTSGQKNPVFSNLGVFDPGDYLPIPGKDGATLDLLDVQYHPCTCWPYGFLLITFTFRDRLTLATAYEEGPYSTAVVERFLEYVDGYLP